jgi:hypothetical protein
MTSKEAREFKVNDAQKHQFVRMQVTKANLLSPDLMHPIWPERGRGGALSFANLKPASVSKSRTALSLFFNADTQTGEFGPVQLTFAAWKVKASEADLLTGTSVSARDMSARRLLTCLKTAKWISESKGFGNQPRKV